MSSIAAETRRAIDERPSFRKALRAGVLNYTAAARLLDVEGDTGAVASALRRYEAELPEFTAPDRSVRVRMERAVSADTLTIFESRPAAAEPTAIALEGDLDATLFARVLSSLSAGDLPVVGAGQVDDQGIVLVDGTDASQALRLVEAAIE